MGKKNRRKKANKKERKEQLEERRERLYEIVDDDDSEYDESESDDEPEDLSIQMGSRVFYATEGSREMRGIVKEIPSEEDYVVLPVDKADKFDFCLDLVERQVIKDNKEWTLRFKVGDNVVFHYSSDSPWLRGSITGHFPCHFDDEFVSCYTCIKDGDIETEYSLPLDTDDWVMAHPQSFRYSVGDDVVIASELALGVKTRMTNEAWIRGKITKVDILGRSDFYAAYQCSYIDRKRSRKCFVFEDNDEHITSLTSTPRERLFEAIEQDCSYEHIANLIESSGLDVMAFRDLFLSKAIENASYSALLWLQESAGEDLVRIHDPLGNTILHQIAKSPHAERFFAAAAAKEWKDEDSKYEQDQDSEYEPTIDLVRITQADDDAESSFFLARNNHGRTFLHELIVLGNKRSFDFLLSPSMGLAWKSALCYIVSKNSGPFSNIQEMMRDKNGLNLKDTARLLGRFEMEKMVDEFNEWNFLYEMSCWLDSVSAGYKDSHYTEGVLDEARTKFGEGAIDGESPLSIWKRLIKFRKRWYRRAPSCRRRMLSVKVPLIGLSRIGQYDVFSCLIEADYSLEKTTQRLWGAGPPNPSAFTEEYKEAEEENDETELNLVEFAAIGPCYSHDKYQDEARKEYISILRSYDIRKGISLVGHMIPQTQRKMSSSYYTLKPMLEDRIRLLEDDKSLQGRLRILDYLVKQKGLSPPTVLSVVRWRQCGVLRWLLENCFINLEEPACDNASIMREGKGLAFLGGKSVRVPQNMSVGVFLCFAAIEFDDVQSFEWLVENQGVPLSSIVHNGLNTLHCCASLGRAEIVLWLLQSQSQSTVKSLLEIKCSRSPWNGYYAAHIAVKEGFTFTADTLLSSGCPKAVVESGKTLVDIAMSSSLDYVREWGREKAEAVTAREGYPKAATCLVD